MGFGGLDVDGVDAAEETLSGGVFVSLCTDPEGVAFTPPETAVWSAVGCLPSGGGDEGVLGLSGIAANGQSSDQVWYGDNVNFYQLERRVSTNSENKN